MKTLNFDLFENYQLSIEEMITIRGGEANDGDPTPTTPPLPIKV
jgi:hypothetical protein